MKNGSTYYSFIKRQERTTYDVARSPKDGLWYLIGNCGDGYWMPVSIGFLDKLQAIREMGFQKKRDYSARAEVLGWDGR